MKKWVYLFILLVANTPALSQVDTTDTIDNKRHAIQINPVGILGGALGLNYEYRFMQRHAIFVEGSYVFPLFQNTKGYGADMQYRFRFHPQTRSNFVGLFFKTAYAQSTIPVDRTNYDFSYKCYAVGINYGWVKRLFKTKLDYEYHVGLGIPFSAFTWKNGRPDKIGTMQTSTFEKIYKYTAALDAGLSFGLSF